MTEQVSDERLDLPQLVEEPRYLIIASDEIEVSAPNSDLSMEALVAAWGKDDDREPLGLHLADEKELAKWIDAAVKTLGEEVVPEGALADEPPVVSEA